jgi:hypothetical protein
MTTKERERGGRFLPYTNHLRGGGVRTVNADTAGVHTSQRSIHAIHRVYSMYMKKKPIFFTGEDELS